MSYDSSLDYGDGDHDQQSQLDDDGDYFHFPGCWTSDDDDEDGGSKLSAARCDLRDHRMIRVEHESPIQSMVNDDLKKLTRDISAMREMDSLQVCVGRVTTPIVAPDRLAARLAARVIRGMTSIRTLRLNFISLYEKGVRMNLGDPGDDEAWEIGSRDALDCFLAQIAWSSVRLSRLELDCFGLEADPWNRFADSLAPNIEYLEVDARFISSEPLASAFAASLQGCFRSLVEITLTNAIRHRPAEPVKLALSAISCSATIRTLTVTLAEKTVQPALWKAVAEQLRHLTNVVNQCPSLKELTLRSDSHNTCDVAMLLDGLLPSKSLAELRLVGLCLGNTNNSELKLDQAFSINRKLKKFVLSDCRLFEDDIALLACYKGLESIEFSDVYIEPPAGARTKGMFERLDSNVSFSAETRSNDHLAWIASSISAAPTLRKVSLSLASWPLPAVTDVLVECLATCELSLELSGLGRGSHAPFLCKGIDTAEKLTKLKVVVLLKAWAEAAAILKSVQANSVLTRFTCHLWDLSSEDVENLGPYIEALLSNNSTLECFGCSCYSDSGLQVTTKAVKYAIRGACHNRRLLAVEFGSSQPNQTVVVDVGVSEEIVRVLQSFNTTLQRIEGLEYATREHEAHINSLLELNRHGRDFVEKGHRVPANLWGGVLMRISNDDCNCFVTELARKALFLPEG
jgi:hypothetical protein